MHAAIKEAEAHDAGQQHTGKPLRGLAPPAQQQPEHPQPDDTDQKQCPETPLVIHHAEQEVALLIPVRHQRKGGGGKRAERYDAQRAAELGAAQRFALEHHAAGRTEQKQRHIEPAGVIARIEGVERAVKRRHQRAYQADFEHRGKRVPPAHTAEHQSARDADNRQIGRKACPFGDAAVEQVGQVGRVRHQESAGQNGRHLLGATVDKVAVALERVDRARILQKREDSRDQQRASGRAAEDRLKRKTAEQPRGELVNPADAEAGEIQDQEDRLSGKEKVIGQKIERSPQREPAVFAVEHRFVQRGEHIREEGGAVEEEVKEDIIKVEPAEGVEHCADDRPLIPLCPAAHPEEGPAARDRKFQAEHWHHGERHPAGGHQQRKPEKRRTQTVVGVGVDEPAAEIGRPAEGTALLDKGVGIGVKRDHLVVEIAGIVKEPAIEGIHNTVRRKQSRRQPQAVKKNPAITGACHMCGKCTRHGEPP